LDSLKTKKERLVSLLKQFEALIVAFSGGVDSTFLLAVAHETLKKNLVAITAESPIHPARENQAAVVFAQNLGVQHIVLQSREMSRPDFIANTKDRCYICKKYLLEDLLKIAKDMGIENVAHGVNVDDLEDFRPGFAAAYEMGIKAPLVDAGLNKDDIRALSKQMNLKTWNKPPMACLATRIPYGTPITEKALNMVDGNVARIEVDPVEIERVLEKGNRSAIIGKLREIGFFYVALDMEGYQQGSMNRVL